MSADLMPTREEAPEEEKSMSEPNGHFHFKNRKIVILGLARQGLALARFFVKAGAQVTISDTADTDALADELKQLGNLPVTLVLGAHPQHLLDGCHLLCLSGGVPPQIPLVQEAIHRGIPLSNDSLLTMQLAPCPVIAITGSSGKTTTTTLVGEMLRASGRGAGREAGAVHVGGNIGTPLLDRLDKIQPQDLIVLELSSFQLELFDPAIAYGPLDRLGPDVAAILNLTPNHLDRHPSMAAYARAKLNLTRHLKPSSALVLGADNPVTAHLGGWAKHAPPLPREWELEELLARCGCGLIRCQRVLPFSRSAGLGLGAWATDDALVYVGQEFVQRADVRLRGEHNISNLLAAAAISGVAGADVAAMGQVARSFAGVPHRLEEVQRWDGVVWINDSIATAPERAVAGLRVFPPGDQTLILLAGGKDKNLPWDTFADEVLERVQFLIGFGQAGPMIAEKVQDRAAFRQVSAPGCAVVQRLDEAVLLADKIAMPGAVVLLSPGGTSYDAYKNFEQRGEHFRRLVAELAGGRVPVGA